MTLFRAIGLSTQLKGIEISWFRGSHTQLTDLKLTLDRYDISPEPVKVLPCIHVSCQLSLGQLKLPDTSHLDNAVLFGRRKKLIQTQLKVAKINKSRNIIVVGDYYDVIKPYTKHQFYMTLLR